MRNNVLDLGHAIALKRGKEAPYEPGQLCHLDSFGRGDVRGTSSTALADGPPVEHARDPKLIAPTEALRSMQIVLGHFVTHPIPADFQNASRLGLIPTGPCKSIH